MTMSETITYAKCGDYEIPCIELEPAQTHPLGKYGRMRRAYLRESNTLLYNHLILTGKLFPHLLEIQQTATARMEQLMSELLKQNPPPDKKANQLEWAQHMNALRAEAEELVCNERIYN